MTGVMNLSIPVFYALYLKVFYTIFQQKQNDLTENYILKTVPLIRSSSCVNSRLHSLCFHNSSKNCVIIRQ